MQISLPARPLRRGLAFLLDFIAIEILIFGPFGQWIETHSVDAEAGIPAGTFLGVTFIFFLVMVYFILFDYLSGQSLGMMAFGLLTTGKDMKSRPSLAQCFGRNLAFMLIPFFIISVADIIYMGLAGKRVSDLMAGTAVIEKASYGGSNEK
jgi:uncharacterized RDD family membrane protein YckC